MDHKITVEEKIELVKEAVRDCQKGVLTPLSAIMAIGAIVDPIVVTDQMLEGVRQWVEEQGLESEARAALAQLGHAESGEQEG